MFHLYVSVRPVIIQIKSCTTKKATTKKKNKDFIIYKNWFVIPSLVFNILK